MKKIIIIVLLSTVTFFSAQAQTETKSFLGYIYLTPDKVIIPSTGEYVYLARTAEGKAVLYVSKNAELYNRFRAKGNDSIIVLDGAVFKPLQHYSKRQWKKLSKEIKKSFPLISQRELEEMDFYLLFNYGVFHNSDPTTVGTTTPTKEKKTKKSSDNNGIPDDN